ncbi:AsmA family protein [Enterovibrio norvegicus]|uniref:AsmA family protein n=1 Tax=Enterovibrio norvegicus TaxID=188144 RepID=UPI0010BE9D53|nr:AsmA family protein [Enterovibrio norvegicus]TKF36016.1 AsmA family protein [Enterovibrio norvegicus]
MKKILYILLGLVLLVVVAIGVLVTVINPNDFKPLITEEVKKTTGRELVIDGDMSWRFWPSLGLSVEKLQFKNPEGFAEPNLVSLDKAEMSVSVMPLLSDTLDIGLVSLYGAHVFIQTLPNGTTNLDGLTGGEEAAAPADAAGTTAPASETPQEGTTPADPATAWTIAIGGLDLVDASATVRDDKAGTVSEISTLNLNVGKLETGLWVPIEFNVQGKQNAMAFTARGTTEAMLAKDAIKSQLRKLSVSATLNDPQLTLESVSVTADQAGIAIPANIGFSVKGKANDLAFDTSGTAELLVDDTMQQIAVKGINVATALVGSALPRPKMNVGFKGDVDYNGAVQKVSLANLVANVDELVVDGNASVVLADIPAVRFDLHSKKINVDAFLGGKEGSAPASDDNASQVEAPKPSVPAKKAPLSDVEPDLSALKGLDIAGKILIEEFIANNVEVTDVTTAFAVNRGKATLKQFDAKLYDGTIAATGSLNATTSPARYQVKKVIKNVNVQPLLKAAANEDMLSGKGNIDANLSGVGLSEKRLRAGITGTIAINFADGSVDGINIPEMIREAKATLKGKRAEYVEETKKTDFSALTATFNLGGGNASTRNLKLEAPAIRVRGEGSTNLIAETIDFDIVTSVVGTSKGQGGKDIDELNDVSIPVALGGTWQAPTYELDVKALLSNNKVLEEKARKEAERGLKKLLGDKADDDNVKQVADKLLKGLFN